MSGKTTPTQAQSLAMDQAIRSAQQPPTCLGSKRLIADIVEDFQANQAKLSRFPTSEGYLKKRKKLLAELESRRSEMEAEVAKSKVAMQVRASGVIPSLPQEPQPTLIEPSKLAEEDSPSMQILKDNPLSKPYIHPDPPSKEGTGEQPNQDP